MRGLILMASVTLLALGGCNQSSRDGAPSASNSAIAARPSLPAGSSCSASVNTFRALIDSDLVSGHTTRPVHAQMTQEINAAAQLCAGGNDAGARAAISASRNRHGYPAG